MVCKDFVKRGGRFSLHVDLLADDRISDSILAMMQDIVVISCQFDSYNQIFEYVGLSPWFDIVDDHADPPTYVFEVELETLKVTIERV